MIICALIKLNINLNKSMSSVKTFIARQPIFDRKQNVIAYELLFRHPFENSYDGSDPAKATSRVILDNLMLMDLDLLLGGKLAFINATRESLIENHMTLLPKEKTVVEIVEDIEPDDEVISACKRLKDAGYKLAIDDFCDQENLQPFLKLADIIKVDFLQIEKEKTKKIIEKYSDGKIKFLAEKLVTQDIYRKARSYGYHYFQGYYFSRPAILTGRRIAGSRARYLDLLRGLSKQNFDIDKIELILKHDISLSYRLLRYINSAFFGLRQKISSVRHALIMLGEIELKKWISVVALASLIEDKPSELFVQSLIRAKFCELIASFSNLSEYSDKAFLMGMFSLLDAMLNQPLPKLLLDLPIDEEIRNALMGQSNSLGKLLGCCMAYERGDWQEFEIISKELEFDFSVASDLYLNSVEWGQDSLVAIA